MKTTRNNRGNTSRYEVAAVKMHGFKRSEEQFCTPQEFEMAAGFYNVQDNWNQMLLKTMHNMRLSCQFFS